MGNGEFEIKGGRARGNHPKTNPRHAGGARPRAELKRRPTSKKADATEGRRGKEGAARRREAGEEAETGEEAESGAGGKVKNEKGNVFCDNITIF